MAVQDQIQISGSVGGSPIQSTVQVESEASTRVSISVPAAIAGTLTTRTDPDTGVLTVAEGHGIVGTDVVSLFWTGGHRRDVVVDSVTATTISFGSADPGDGDDLPDQGSSVNLCKQVDIEIDFSGDEVVLIGCSCDARAVLGFMESAVRKLNAELKTGNGRHWFWLKEDAVGTANPLTDVTVDQLRVAQEAVSAKIFRFGVNYDA